MRVDDSYYLEHLYPFQDAVLAAIMEIDTGFYLTGGTALSRGYLQHRYSEDLDIFVNDEPMFRRWAGQIIERLTEQHKWGCTVDQQDDVFVRLSLARDEVLLRVEMINDVPAHVGDIQQHATLGRLDSIENIFANKLTAVLGRSDPKDLADVWAITQRSELSVTRAIADARSKAAGIFPVALAQVFLQVTEADWERILWQQPPPVSRFVGDLAELGESLILGKGQRSA